ncbi:MAG TPA: glycoside hydrolase family 15 protein, partial [Pyrinomonadaceae bacterium]|nr:glycoside hydrolase family 15 protein [Pyrinomonadaceae bacterium]
MLTIHFNPLRLCVFAVMLSVITSAQTLGPSGPGRDAQWMTAAKQAIGTSATRTSKVWFTLAEGVLSEVYYPDVTTANVQMLQFIVIDPKTKKVETEKDDATHKIRILRPDALAFQQINTAKSRKWTITKTYTIGSYPDTIHIDISFQTNKKGLKIYVQYDPSLGNSGMYDSGGLRYRSDCSACDLGGHPILASMDEKTGISSKLFFSSEISEIDSSFAGSDGVIQIRKFGKIVRPSITPGAGNIVQTARIDQPSRFTAILVFGRRFDDAEGSMDGISFASSLAEYEGGWSNYVKTLPQVEAKYQAQFNMAAMILKALEDKAHPGANIASLSVPWGGGANANENNVGGYHLVWSRDIVQSALGLLASGRKGTARRALIWLACLQEASGRLPQNSWI